MTEINNIDLHLCISVGHRFFASFVSEQKSWQICILGKAGMQMVISWSIDSDNNFQQKSGKDQRELVNYKVVNTKICCQEVIPNRRTWFSISHSQNSVLHSEWNKSTIVMKRYSSHLLFPQHLYLGLGLNCAFPCFLYSSS